MTRPDPPATPVQQLHISVFSGNSALDKTAGGLTSCICCPQLYRQRALCSSASGHHHFIQNIITCFDPQPAQATAAARIMASNSPASRRARRLFHIPAQQADTQVRAIMVQASRAPNRGGANMRALRQRIQISKWSYQRIASVLTGQDSGDNGAIGNAGFHIFHGMDSRICLARKQGCLQGFYKNAFAANLYQRAIQYLISFVKQTRISVWQGTIRDCTSRVCTIASSDLRLASTSGAVSNVETNGSVMRLYSHNGQACKASIQRLAVAYSATSAYSESGGQVQTRFRSPNTLSIRATGGQYLSLPARAAGRPPRSRL